MLVIVFQLTSIFGGEVSSRPLSGFVSSLRPPCAVCAWGRLVWERINLGCFMTLFLSIVLTIYHCYTEWQITRISSHYFTA